MRSLGGYFCAYHEHDDGYNDNHDNELFDSHQAFTSFRKVMQPPVSLRYRANYNLNFLFCKEISSGRNYQSKSTALAEFACNFDFYAVIVSNPTRNG